MKNAAFWLFYYVVKGVGKDDTGTGRPDNGTQAEGCRI